MREPLVYLGEFGQIYITEIRHNLVRHAHEQIQIIFCLNETDALIEIKGKSYSLTTRKAICINPLEAHRLEKKTKNLTVRALVINLEESWVGKKENAKETGRKALELKANINHEQSLWKIPTTRPVRLSSNACRNVIAFSLFGSNPRYCETAILNVEKAKLLFPNWKCRFYLNKSVPESIQLRLSILGAQIIRTDSTQWQGIPPLMWRFAVMDDASVDRFLLRDADSIFSTREQHAVQAWLDSEKWFHHMRDFYTHTELILAGMFGGSAGVFSNLKRHIKNYARLHQGEQRVVDQHFLRKYIWPTVRENLMSHDSWFGFHNSSEFPETEKDLELGPNFHVGCNFATSSIGEDSLNLDVNHVVWKLLDQKNKFICSYVSEVIGGSWRASLPKTYIENIRSNNWKISKT